MSLELKQSPAAFRTRRSFLKSGLRYGLGVASLWALGLSLVLPDSERKTGFRSKAVLGPFDWSLSDAPRKIAVVHTADRTSGFDAAMNVLGGMETFVRPGDRVLIKVNAAFASPPSIGATTHPELVEAVIRRCLRAGAGEVTVTDHPIHNPESCFRISGIGAAVRRAGGRLLAPSESDFGPATLPDGRLLRDWPVLLKPLRHTTKLINIAPVKHHHRAGASMTLKNMYGFLGGPRSLFHQDVHRVIGELAVLFRPTLVVLDGIESMVSNGPTGGSFSDLEATQTLIVSPDPVAADTLGASLLGLAPDALPYLALAEKMGAGTRPLDELEILRVRAS